MAKSDEPRIYQALMLPEQALERGGVEILRAGIIDDELYVGALRAFDNPSQWGEVLGEIARRLGAIYAAQVQGLSKKDATVQIAEAFAAEMGAKKVETKPAAKTKPAKKASRKPANKSPKKRKR